MKPWQLQPQGRRHDHIVEWVETIEREQSYLYDRMYKLRCLYDPYYDRVHGSGLFDGARAPTDAYMSENLIASNVDTVTAKIAAIRLRARFMTDGGTWSEQRKAKRLEWYAEGLAKLACLQRRTQRAFKVAANLGSGLLKICADRAQKRIVCEVVQPDDIIVDELECADSAEPRQLHHRRLVDKGRLIAAYPDHTDAIERASDTLCGRKQRLWASYRPIARNQVVVIESWSRPLGDDKGIHAVIVPGATLVDEDWSRDGFPFVHFVWSDREGWYGIGLSERIAGHQREQNKRHWFVGRRLDQGAAPITYVSSSDAQLAVGTVNRIGTIVPINGRPPTTVIMPAVSGEEYARLEATRRLAFEETGVSRVSATSRKEPGIESAVALREYRDQTSERFALQELVLEDGVLEAFILLLQAAKDLGADAPTVVRRRYRGAEQLELADIDLELAALQIEAASTLPRTPAGRTQLVQEWADAGILDPDEARRLIDHPDLAAALSIYVAAIDDIDRTIEEMLDGRSVMPEPYQNLRLGLWRVTRAYLRAEADGAPEDVCERLREWLAQAGWMVARAEAPTAPAAPTPPAGVPLPEPGAAGAPPAGGGGPLVPELPTAA